MTRCFAIKCNRLVSWRFHALKVDTGLDTHFDVDKNLLQTIVC
jgi:hypothetical protein